MKSTFRHYFLAIITAMLIIPVSCVDLEFDEPPAGGEDPNLPVNITIAELKSRHTLEQYEEITDDVTFQGLVISNDAASNFFKQLVIQDATAGIEMRIEMTDLNNLYPVGRKVYVKAKGLWLGDYNGLVQLGAGEGIDDQGDPILIRIPESLIDQYIVPATYGNDVAPKTLTIDDLTFNAQDSLVSTLVRFEGMQFIAADAGEVYAVFQDDTNRELEDCSDQRLILRTSGYASFASDSTPVLNGTITGVLSIFGDTYQLTIRDLEDVAMEDERCGGGNPGGTQAPIDSVRGIFSGSPTTISSTKIKGIVISDFNSASVTGKNLYIQDATGGIAIRFADFHSFALGSELIIDLNGGLMDEYFGLLQVDGLSLGAVTLVGTPGDVTPREATVQQVLTNAQAWESTLVKIKDVTLSGNSVFDGSVTATDASGAMILFTRSQSTFAQSALPTGLVTLTVIVSEYDTPQLIIRNIADVTGGGTGGGDEFDITEIRQLFASGSTTAPSGTIQGVVISDFASQSVTGRNLYIQDATGGIVVRFAQNHTFAIGSELKITLNGGALSEFNGLLQIDGINNTAATVVGTPGDVSPRITTVSEVLSNHGSWESTLVSIPNVTLTGNTVYNGEVTVSDGTGTIIMFTRSASVFAQDAIPGATVTLTGIVSEFNVPQLIIRTTADVKL